MSVMSEVSFEAHERGFRASMNGVLDPHLGVPWLSVALFVAAVLVAALIAWPVALPFVAIGLGVLTPNQGAVVYGFEVGNGELTLIGAETVPLHTFDRVEVEPRALRFVGRQRTARVELEGSEEAIRWLADQLNGAIEQLGDPDDVPQALQHMQNDAPQPA